MEDVTTIAVIVALIMNFGALIWGAATLSATVRFQGKQVERTARVLDETVKVLHAISTRVRVLEAKAGFGERSSDHH